MDEQQLRREVGEALGYSVYHYTKGRPGYYQLVDDSFTPVVYSPTYRTGERETEAQAWNDLPSLAEFVASMLEEIDRRDQRSAYFDALRLIFAVDGDSLNADYAWALLTITPEQHARAFLKVMNAV